MADFGKLNFSVSFNPTSGFPLDARYYFSTLASAQEAAASAVEVGSADGTYFIGQNIVVVEGDTATLYVIQPNKELKAVGAAPVGDNKSIEVAENGTISLKGLANAKTGAYPAKKADGTIEWVTPTAASTYTIEKEASATAGYLSSYTLKKDGVQVGNKIDIPKDYLVKSASVKDSVGEGDPSGLPAGVKYIDFIINAKDDDGKESHVNLNVNELVDAYTAGTGISISGENEIGVKVVAANGLSVDASGIKMAVATTGTAGALSAADKTKLDSVSSGAQANVIESISINGEKISPVEKDVPIPIASATRLGVIKADNTSISISGDGTASVKSVNTSLLSQNEDDVLIIDCSI